jgi:glycosyltransferase involved in cell wall biosynthesis
MAYNETPNKPNILYVFGGEKAQGAEIVIERLMAYNNDNVNTHLIMSPGDFADSLISSNKPYQIQLLTDLKKLNRSSSVGITFLFKAVKNYFSVSYEVGKYIVRNKIRIVHANTIVPASYLVPLIIYARLFMPRVKWYWSDHDMRYFSGLETTLSKFCTTMYDKTLVVSAAVKRKYGLNAGRVEVLYNGLDTQIFKPDEQQRQDFRQKWGLTAENITIGMVAVINPDKNQLALIEVFNQLNLIYPNSRLLLAGSYASQFPEYSVEVKQAINRSPKVTHVGFLSNIVDFYNGCDIIVSNSNANRSESLGTSIYEAMACEKLVVAADTGGTPEIIDDKINGLMFRTDDLTDLKSKLAFALEHYHELATVKYAGRAKAQSKFSINAMVKNYNSIIHIDNN